MKKFFAVLLALGLVVSIGGAEEVRDEDYHPEGEDAATSPFYNGIMNKLEEKTDQLEPGMGTTTYGASDPAMSLSDFDDQLSNMPYVSDEEDAKWHDSIGSHTRADQWAYSPDLSYAISNRGVPYKPGKTYYHDDYNGDTISEPYDDSVPKTVKVMGNSLAVVAATTLSGDHGDIYPGDGFWIDPDEIKEYADSGRIQTSDWLQLYQYGIDISGKDSGLGFDLGDGTGVSYKNTDYYAMYGDVYFKGEASGSVAGQLEKPMCGDDRKEFLLEEIGESTNPARFSGQYACSNNRGQCVDMSSSGSKFFDTGTVRQADEPDEEYGRLKNDKEVCQKYVASEEPHVSKDDIMPNWYDQDYMESLCKDENTLFGVTAKRWVSNDTVDRYPSAFTGGIDDDWNARFEQLWGRDKVTKNYTTKTYREDWSKGDPYDQLESPVSSGSVNQSTGESNASIATLGFCAGDDEGENVVIQQCNGGVCGTNKSVYGVAENPSSCIMKNYDNHPEYGTSSNDQRDLFTPGENVTFETGSEKKTVACFQGEWYQEWPIVFNRGHVSVTEGETRQVSFRLINPEMTDTTFEVELFPVTGNLRDAWVGFPDRQDTFTTTVPAQGSRTYSIEIYGGNTNVDSSEIEVQAVSSSGELRGRDQVTVDVTKKKTGQAATESTRDVPGIGAVQLLIVAASATMVYFFTL